MHNLYPLFERNRILKKELLWSLRDYSFAHVQLEYQEYGQGILKGCDINVDQDELVVGAGILKYGEFVCILMSEERICYEPAEQMQYLKIRVDVDQDSPDYIAYHMRLILETDEKKKENEFELCRFHLKSGAKLRSKYKDFADMETEYDTINLLYADWAGLGGRSLSPTVTRFFSEVVLSSANSQTDDRNFAYLCLTKSGAVPAKVLTAYAADRKEMLKDSIIDAYGIYRYLCIRLDNIQKGREQRIAGRKEKHRIFID